jgi:S-DNA-T family DNA segregation ATPase FtsK/SpoIIIE
LRGLVRVLIRHADDLGGLLLLATGMVAAMGVYAHAGGPAGRGLADGLATGFGRLEYVMPLALVVGGGALIWWRRPGPWDAEDPYDATDDDEPAGRTTRTTKAAAAAAEQPARAAQVTVGLILLSISALGIAHVSGGAPKTSAPADDLRAAGGWLGAVIAGPLYGVLSTWGSACVLAAIGVLGLVVLTRTPIRVAADRTLAGVRRPLADKVRPRVDDLFRLPAERDAAGAGIDGGADGDGRVGTRGPTRRTRGRIVGPDDDLGVPFGLDQAPNLDDDTLEEEIDPSLLPVDGAAEGADGAGKPRAKGRRKKSELVDAELASGPAEQLAINLGPAAKGSPWKLPPVTLLDRSASAQIDRRAVEETGRTLERALAEHGVETRLVGMVVGPTVSRFELELAPGVKVNRVTSLHKDIAYAMATPDVRILAPIPGKQAIGVEVPNVRRQIVALGDILTSDEARKASHPLDVAVGRDINGRSVLMNLAAMPHLLIAGATGAGKSSCLNSLLTSVLVRTTPDQVRMILIDPKRVEMGQYDKLPHLLTQVVTNPKKAANALAWAVKEMERRYDLLAEVGFRDITGYNAAVAKGDLGTETNAEGEVVREYPRLPFILVVIDELADLMMVAARDVEESICRLAQMARAVGIHLVIATQRPSVNVITGLIKANVPARLAFAVSSVTDSRVILDQPGAERLIGKGDMLLLEGGSSVARRLQGAWVNEEEVRKVAGVWKRQAPDVAFDQTVQGSDDEGSGGGSRSGGGGDDDDDDLLNQAMELVVRSQLGSTSMLQRKLRVGFARAGRLMDLLEQNGVVGPSEGSKARAVLMTVEELEERPE